MSPPWLAGYNNTVVYVRLSLSHTIPYEGRRLLSGRRTGKLLICLSTEFVGSGIDSCDPDPRVNAAPQRREAHPRISEEFPAIGALTFHHHLR